MPGEKLKRSRKDSLPKKEKSPAAEATRLARENRSLRRQLKECREECANVEKRVGQLLHDGVCQDLSAVTFYLQGLKIQVARNNLSSIGNILQQVSESVKRAVESTHSLSKDLRK